MWEGSKRNEFDVKLAATFRVVTSAFQISGTSNTCYIRLAHLASFVRCLPYFQSYIPPQGTSKSSSKLSSSCRNSSGGRGH